MKPRARDPETSTNENKCPVCGKPIKGMKGAKVYHWDCLYESLKEIREKTTKPI